MAKKNNLDTRYYIGKRKKNAAYQECLSLKEAQKKMGLKPDKRKIRLTYEITGNDIPDLIRGLEKIKAALVKKQFIGRVPGFDFWIAWQNNENE